MYERLCFMKQRVPSPYLSAPHRPSRLRGPLDCHYLLTLPISMHNNYIILYLCVYLWSALTKTNVMPRVSSDDACHPDNTTKSREKIFSTAVRFALKYTPNRCTVYIIALRFYYVCTTRVHYPTRTRDDIISR